MTKEIRVGLVGSRFMGKAHSNAYLKVEKFFDLDCTIDMRSVCGRNQAELEPFAKRFGWSRAETDWKKLTAAADIDLIDVCTPGDTHALISIAAAKAGKHVFCEKPLANSLADAKQMLAAVREAGVRHMVNFNYRRAPAVALAKRMIDDGAIGEVRQYRATYLQDWLADASSPMSWRLVKEVAGSGAHGDLNAHAIDLARYLTGEEIVQVVGDMKTFIHERPWPDGSSSGVGASGATDQSGVGKVTVDDATTFLARFSNGAIGTFEATRMARGRKNYNRLEVNGTRGTLVWNFEDMNMLEYFSADDPADRQGFRQIMATEDCHPYVAAWWPPGHVLGYEHGFVNGVYDLCQAITRGEEVAPDFRDGAQCVAVLEAVEASCQSGAWQTVEHVE